MTKKNSPPEQPAPAPVEQIVEETPFEAAASICSVLVVGLFILTFLAQNFVIPSLFINVPCSLFPSPESLIPDH